MSGARFPFQCAVKARLKYLSLAPFIVLCLLQGCISLAVYGPHDFISDSVRKNLRTGQPFGDRGMAQDAYARFSQHDFDFRRIQEELEAASATCTRNASELRCAASRSWMVVWPKPTRDMDGELRTERRQPVHAVITYQIRINEQGGPTVGVDVSYANQ
jgi:hypothetical protein